MRLHTLPDVLFPNPVNHPNYKLACMIKVKEDIFNIQYCYERSRLPTRMTVRSMKKSTNRASLNNTQHNFRSASSKLRIIREHSFIEEIDETFSRTRTPSGMAHKFRRGFSLVDKQL